MPARQRYARRRPKDTPNHLVVPPIEVRPPPFPARPDLFDEVEWGPFPTQEEVEKAYRLWSTQDRSLAPFPEDLEDQLQRGLSVIKHEPEHCLVENVYRELLLNSLLPLKEEYFDSDAQCRYDSQTDSAKGWTYEELSGQDSTPEVAVAEQPPQPAAEPAVKPAIFVNNRNIVKDKWWIKSRLQNELRRRGLDQTGVVDVLRRRIYDDELQKLTKPEPTESTTPAKDKGSFLPREDLSHWGIPRKEDYMLKISEGRDLSPLDMYTWAILLSPYNPGYWASRAFLHYQMGYFDLAIGDAYRAQLLCEVLVNPLSRNPQPGLYIRVWDAIERHVLLIPRAEGSKMSAEVRLMRQPNGVVFCIPSVRKAIHHIIVLSLLAMQCWKDYQVTEPALRTRLAMPDQDAMAVRMREEGLKEYIGRVLYKKHNNEREFFFERRYGCAHGRPYPYGPRTNQRTKAEFVDKINRDILAMSQTPEPQAQKIEVRVNPNPDLDDLGVYATEDIPQGEVIYVDEPSIRGHLPVKRLWDEDKYCENCKRAVNPVAFESDETSVVAGTADICNCFKLANQSIYWCASQSQSEEQGQPGHVQETSREAAGRSGSRKRSRTQNDRSEGTESSSKRQKLGSDPNGGGRPSCLGIAKTLYHHRACGKNWTWLHDAMRPKLVEEDLRMNKDAQMHYTNEDHGTILSLLLREVFDITLNRRETEGKPNLFAHEIDELMPLMGAEDLSAHNFPFSFAANVRVPFDILSCLGVNIFRDMTFDTWVIQLVLRKLLLNVIPWDPSRRLIDGVPKQSAKDIKENSLRNLPEEDFHEVDPTIRDLYIFPGVAMFNNSCKPHHNVIWEWDRGVPNRLILWTNRPIEKGEQLLIQYSNWRFETARSYQILGNPCYCPVCRDRAPTTSPPPDEEAFGDDTTPDYSDHEYDDDDDDDNDNENSEEPPSEYDDPGQMPSNVHAAPSDPPPPPFVPSYQPFEVVAPGQTSSIQYLGHVAAEQAPVAAAGHPQPAVPAAETRPEPETAIRIKTEPEDVAAGQSPVAEGHPQPAAPATETRSEAETEVEIKREPGADMAQPQAPAQAPAPAPAQACAAPRRGPRIRYRERIMDVHEYRRVLAQQRPESVSDSRSSSPSHDAERSDKENQGGPA